MELLAQCGEVCLIPKGMLCLHREERILLPPSVDKVHSSGAGCEHLVSEAPKERYEGLACSWYGSNLQDICVQSDIPREPQPLHLEMVKISSPTKRVGVHYQGLGRERHREWNSTVDLKQICLPAYRG